MYELHLGMMLKRLKYKRKTRKLLVTLLTEADYTFSKTDKIRFEYTISRIRTIIESNTKLLAHATVEYSVEKAKSGKSSDLKRVVELLENVSSEQRFLRKLLNALFEIRTIESDNKDTPPLIRGYDRFYELLLSCIIEITKQIKLNYD